MIDIAYIGLGIIILFTIFIALRSVFSLKVCALCGAVVLTWITLIALVYVDYEINLTFIGLLMGGSIVGTMYILEQKLQESYHLFKLPFFLTLVYVAYFVLEQTVSIALIGMIVLVWVVLGVVYAGRHIKSLKKLGQNIIACCKNW